ncbi:hypothetical protein EV1_001537 [Malus domestica]
MGRVGFPDCQLLDRDSVMTRSNVGKSPLLNSLMRQKRLAMTSKKPGDQRENHDDKVRASIAHDIYGYIENAAHHAIQPVCFTSLSLGRSFPASPKLLPIRFSAVHMSLRVAKSGAKNRNRQAVKTPDFSPLTGEISRFVEQRTSHVAVAAAYESKHLLGSRLGRRRSHIKRSVSESRTQYLPAPVQALLGLEYTSWFSDSRKRKREKRKEEVCHLLEKRPRGRLERAGKEKKTEKEQL